MITTCARVQLRLSCAAKGRQDDLAGITVEFGIAQAHCGNLIATRNRYRVV